MTGLWLSLWLALASATGTIELVVGGVTVSAEVADDAAERSVGLMGRQSLPKNHGMLFVYPDEAVRSFWMKNTPLPSAPPGTRKGQHYKRLDGVVTTHVGGRYAAGAARKRK